MPPTAHWGKRHREEEGENFVRFSDLSPAAKMERRKEERAEKKERDRTFGYFVSVQRALQANSGGGGDAGALASIVDGFFTELPKLLKADRTFHLLRNGTVCRVIELALANALLIHIKTLCYLFLEHIGDLMVSPVASYTLETLLVGMSQALSSLAETDEAAFALEMTEGGVGMHAGSGVPSCATLLDSMTEEICERAEDLLVHDIGARALRSMVLVLGGQPIRNAPLPAHPVVFESSLGKLARQMVKALEEGYGREYQTANAAESWMAAAQCPATSLVMQSFLRVGREDNGAVDTSVRQRLDQLSYKRDPILYHFLLDPLGCHLFQAYVKVPPSPAMLEAGDAAAAELYGKGRAASSEDEDAKAETSAMEKMGSCCWSRAAEVVFRALPTLLAPGSEQVSQISYVLHDLALYAPTAVHLHWFWKRLVEPRLHDFFTIAALSTVVAQLVKKYAFGGVAIASAEASSGLAQDHKKPADITHHGVVLQPDVLQMLQKEMGQHVRYMPVETSLQMELCAALCAAAGKQSKKGAVQFFMVDGSMGERGYDVARYLLHLSPRACLPFQQALEKVKRDDLVTLLTQRHGSVFVQQYVRVSALQPPKAGSGEAGAAAPVEAPLRLLRRLHDVLETLIYDRYAAYVVEALYECGSLAVKEALVKALVPLLSAMRRNTGAANRDVVESLPVNTGTAEGEQKVVPLTASQRRHIAEKVMAKCCVEQYVHRPEDWKKLAERQCHVQRLMQRMLLD